MAYNPLIVFLWSSIFYSVGSYLIDRDGFWFVLGIMFMGLGIFSTRYLNGITLNVSSYIIHLIGLFGVFAGVLSVNNLDVIRDNIYLSSLVLGVSASCFILSGFRFFFQIRNN